MVSGDDDVIMMCDDVMMMCDGAMTFRHPRALTSSQLSSLKFL